MTAEQLRLDDAPPVEGGGFHPMRRVVRRGEVWWIPRQPMYHVEHEPLRYDHIAAYAVFGTVAEAIAAGAREPCRRCARIIADDMARRAEAAEDAL